MPRKLAVILALTSSPAFSQEYKGKARIYGYVFGPDGKSVEGVKVKLFSTVAGDGFEVMTDKGGKWVGSWKRGSGWNIDFEKAGFLPKP